MRDQLFEDLRSQGLLSDASFEKIRQRQVFPLFSVHRELQTALYLGVLSLSTGLGILIYKNIDSIGHQAVLAFIALISAACFYWCCLHKAPFSFEKAEPAHPMFGYILLLGTLSFLTFVGYLQFQYSVFGERYGMATFIPMLVLFFIAYYFDHVGVLSLAIINLAVWMGVSVVPRELVEKMGFGTEEVIYAYSVLGALLLGAAYFTGRYRVKGHFAFSYYNYGVHVGFIALLSGYFFYSFAASLVWLLLLTVLSAFTIVKALRDKSFYFLLVAVFYSYIALSGLLVRSVDFFDSELAYSLVYLYFTASGIGMIFLLMAMNKKIKSR